MLTTAIVRLFAAGLSILSVGPALAQAAPVKSTTVTAAMPTPSDRARQWLTLLDGGNYGQSWNEAAASFKKAHTAAAWSKQAAALRGPLGAMASRNLKSIDLGHSDNVAVVRYDTSFAHKIAVETVTLAFEKGGWAITDYGIQ
jgi:hypothetical protein